MQLEISYEPERKVIIMKKANIIRYKGYYAKIEYVAGKQVLEGHVENIDTDIRFESDRPMDVREDFRAAVDAYLAACEDKGIAPEKTYKGSFNVRIHPRLHRRLAHAAIEEDVSLNAVVEEALCDFLDRRRDEDTSMMTSTGTGKKTDVDTTSQPFES
jgi:predicted HicB family RNase H-like nuclease